MYLVRGAPVILTSLSIPFENTGTRLYNPCSAL